jgi:hypothetical protein
LKKIQLGNSKNWSCKICEKNKRKASTENSPNPKHQKSDGMEISSEDDDDEASEVVVEFKSLSVDEKLDRIMALTYNNNKAIKSLKNTTNVKITKLEEKIEECQDQVNVQADDISDLRNENANLKSQLETMKNDVNYIKQQQLADCIEISGVTPTRNENIKEIITNIAKNAKITIAEEEIVNAYRKKSGKIKAKLSTTSKCDDLVSGSFKNKITNAQIGTTTKTQATRNNTKNAATNLDQIFINNALTISNQLIYKRIRDLKKDKKIFKITFRNSSFAVKPDESASYEYIYNIEQLNKFNE